MDENAARIVELTAQVVSAYCHYNHVEPEALPGLIGDVRLSLAGIMGNGMDEVQGKPVPAVPIKRSVFPDYVVCLEDGRKLKMLKRHIWKAYSLTPQAYRERWGLPIDYPMVAPNYSTRRSALAKEIKLGQRPNPGGQR